MAAYSMDLRKRVVRACDEGRMTREQIAATFEVSTAWIDLADTKSENFIFPNHS